MKETSMTDNANLGALVASSVTCGKGYTRATGAWSRTSMTI